MSYVLEVRETDGELSLNLPEEIHAELGWRIGDKVQFTPSIQFGTFLSSKLEMAEFLSLNLGIGFVF